MSQLPPVQSNMSWHALSSFEHLLRFNAANRPALLRSFVKKVEFNPPQVAIEYTIHLPLEDGLTHSKEARQTPFRDVELLSISK